MFTHSFNIFLATIMCCSMYGAHRTHASGGIKMHNDKVSGNNKNVEERKKIEAERRDAFQIEMSE